ncbi:uncharacterized protein YpiB (UPF0302 family) [Alkalibacillus flavidus]|uniref:Uncharacterized protein YpiB (UPF0302 family) n=1 Tax=Alkalibacillus flavidus TaxID=546021 RepID=A0ABV2KV26_9BACI
MAQNISIMNQVFGNLNQEHPERDLVQARSNLNQEPLSFTQANIKVKQALQSLNQQNPNVSQPHHTRNLHHCLCA